MRFYYAVPSKRSRASDWFLRRFRLDDVRLTKVEIRWVFCTGTLSGTKLTIREYLDQEGSLRGGTWINFTRNLFSARTKFYARS